MSYLGGSHKDSEKEDIEPGQIDEAKSNELDCHQQHPEVNKKAVAGVQPSAGGHPNGETPAEMQKGDEVDEKSKTQNEKIKKETT